MPTIHYFYYFLIYIVILNIYIFYHFLIYIVAELSMFKDSKNYQRFGTKMHGFRHSQLKLIKSVTSGDGLLTVIRLFEDTHFLGLTFETSKEI